MIVALRAPSLAKFGEVDTVPVSENSLTIIYEEITNLYEQPHAKNIDVPTKNAREVINPHVLSAYVLGPKTKMHGNDVIDMMYFLLIV